VIAGKEDLDRALLVGLGELLDLLGHALHERIQRVLLLVCISQLINFCIRQLINLSQLINLCRFGVLSHHATPGRTSSAYNIVSGVEQCAGMLAAEMMESW
jgi:hypothetical protein